mmetsp:Transcript_33546/g.76689  ORF Transcript_33546/g.76689 Transcript_33546/m.76689 type:complete len:265 (-) Transcript_33546:1248-2042(-)
MRESTRACSARARLWTSRAKFSAASRFALASISRCLTLRRRSFLRTHLPSSVESTNSNSDTRVLRAASEAAERACNASSSASTRRCRSSSRVIVMRACCSDFSASTLACRSLSTTCMRACNSLFSESICSSCVACVSARWSSSEIMRRSSAFSASRLRIVRACSSTCVSSSFRSASIICTRAMRSAIRESLSTPRCVSCLSLSSSCARAVCPCLSSSSRSASHRDPYASDSRASCSSAAAARISAVRTLWSRRVTVASNSSCAA